ncbi:hypothetical protein ABTY59_00375 [Streptomyces sp. NPDC096079]|uniref:hypothetical protein n=1 Tax=Streptomyces sp. NPDC096079 TaxID=3155820 RepID=UPI0033317398
MRGSAAPTSPGAWDARSEALLGTPALTAAGALDLRAPAPEDPADAAPSGIAGPAGAGVVPEETVDPHRAEDETDPRPSDPARARTGAGEASEEAAATCPGPGADRRPADGGDAPARGAAWRTAPGAAPAPGSVPEAPTPGLAPAPAPEAPAPVPVPEAPPSVPVPVPVPAPVAPAPAPVPRAPVPVPAPGGASRNRRGNADPVKVLMHRHRELCERAVDPLEIAAGLEAQGFTDRTAARFRHRDVFSLAEELYARVPRGQERPAPAGAPEPARAPWALAALAPGGAAALTGLGLAFAHGPVRIAVGAAGALALGGALLLAVRRGPLRAPDGGTVPAARLWTLWLLAYAVGGDGLLDQVVSGGPDGPWDLTPAPLLGLALAVAPAAWCTHLFTSRARRRIADSRGLADFAAVTRPLLLGTVTLQLLALTALLALTGFSPGALALGALLLLARLLTVHGFPETAAAALAAASAAEALALASVLAARVPLPGFDALAVPVRALVEAGGPGAVPTLVCGAAALGLLAHATGTLTRASAHATR